MSERFTEAGAKRLAKTIWEYWAARGATPRVYVSIDSGSLRANRDGTMYVVRSDMVNGYPRRSAGVTP
jgi:hypothetical protein